MDYADFIVCHFQDDLKLYNAVVKRAGIHKDTTVHFKANKTSKSLILRGCCCIEGKKLFFKK